MSEWWRGAVIYQIYPRSFQDSNGDGIGDLPGITARLPYVAALGVEAIWLSPFMQSPQKDYGYDISDYCAVDPQFGTLEDFDRLVEEAHRLGLKVIIDQVWSHSSDQHPWFKQSRSSKTNDKADWYVWAEARPDGTPPNNWLANFGGAAWSWEARRAQYYLHHFLPEQPALNLRHPDVLTAIEEIARFWLDRGVDGFRLDSTQAYLCDDELRDNPARVFDKDHPPAIVRLATPVSRQILSYSNGRPETPALLARLRRFIDQWPERMLLGEVGGDDSLRRAASYVQPGLMHQAYSFRLMRIPFSAEVLADTISSAEALLEQGWFCWSTSNHDVPRVVSRWGKGHEAHHTELAKLSLAMGLSLRGSFCLYQGEELGLTEVDVPYEKLHDPFGITFYPEFKGRDGCRTPMPWQADAPQLGFSTAAATWLPLGPDHAALAVDRQQGKAESVLTFAQTLLAWRRDQPALRSGTIELMPVPPAQAEALLMWKRRTASQELLCVFNLSEKPQELELTGCLNVKVSAAAHDGKTLRLPPLGYAFLTSC